MIPLICTQCGGTVSVDESMFVKDTDQIYIFRYRQQYKCEHCGTNFIGGEEYKVDTVSINQTAIGNGNIQVGNGAVGPEAVVIGGNVNGSIITTRFNIKGGIHAKGNVIEGDQVNITQVAKGDGNIQIGSCGDVVIKR